MNLFTVETYSNYGIKEKKFFSEREIVDIQSRKFNIAGKNLEFEVPFLVFSTRNITRNYTIIEFPITGRCLQFFNKNHAFYAYFGQNTVAISKQ